MIDYLYQTSDAKLFLILSSFFILISICALLLIKRFMPLNLRYQENAVIGCTCALISVIYGVLAGFATLYLINNNNFASDAVQRETSAIANLYMTTQGLDEPTKTQIQIDIKRYLNQVIDVEWKQMNNGQQVSLDGAFILAAISNKLTHYQTTTATQTAVLTDTLTICRNLYNAREQRIQISYASLSNDVWVVILIGTILMLCVSYLFGVNFSLHVFITCAAALMTASIIFLLISLDKPFQGEFVIGPEMFQSIAKDITLAPT